MYSRVYSLNPRVSLQVQVKFTPVAEQLDGLFALSEELCAFVGRHMRHGAHASDALELETTCHRTQQSQILRTKV